ncbi:MAG TPA: hypothetical protein GX391_09805 [Firmicutes bacterium]|jgi:hypothetical protein|nr:hypothetical protein [Bacillota bacterium]HOQ24791.1 hypothetical protein [Bacillota bacterium]HPT68023.1 hypothetical protein [Bacillota bacterium]
MNLPVVFLALAGTLLLAPATRAAELRWEPVRGRVGYADNRGSYCRLDSGLEMDWGWLQAELDGRLDWPKADQRLQLTLAGPGNIAWSWQLKGYVGQEERYKLGEGAYLLGYAWGPFEMELSGGNYLKRLSAATGTDYGHEDLFAKLTGKWHGLGGQRLSGELVLYEKDYAKRQDYTVEKVSGRLEYQGYFGKNKYTVTYSENVGEYPHRTLKNYFSRGLAVKYRLPRANRRRWEIRASYNRVEKGDGTRPESIGLDLLHALPLGPGELRFGLHRRWKGNVDWLEVYTDEETAGNGGYKRVDVKWTWRLGHKNTWWLGGELTDYDDGFLGSQLDLGRDWQLGQVFFQTRLFYHYNKSGTNAGSWLQATYYFK